MLAQFCVPRLAKRILALLLMASMLLLTACSSLDRDYSKAAEIFSSLGGYEDAASLALYCRACDAAEAGDSHTVGLCADGSVVATGDYDFSGWTDIVTIAASQHHIVGLRADGTVVAVGNNRYGQCDLSHWDLLD